MQIYEELKRRGYPVGWEDVFEESDHGTHNACSIVEKDKIEITPPPELVFNAWRMVPFDRVRVVIVGQNPYPTRGEAEGLAFSCSRGGVPKSLVNIYKELTNSIPGFVAPKNGNLKPWCTQGVMLLNMSLVTEVGNTKYKMGIWMTLIKHTINKLKANPKVIWLLWGNEAQSLGQEIGLACRQLKAIHPSPMNGSRFVGCGHFAEVNKILIQRGEEPIDWRLT